MRKPQFQQSTFMTVSKKGNIAYNVKVAKIFRDSRGETKKRIVSKMQCFAYNPNGVREPSPRLINI